jgi:hypothetical protein
MYSDSVTEKEFFEKQKQNPSKTTKELKELSDRELLERQTFYLMNIEKSSRSIKNNVQFWYYATIISVVLALIILGTK